LATEVALTFGLAVLVVAAPAFFTGAFFVAVAMVFFVTVVVVFLVVAAGAFFVVAVEVAFCKISSVEDS
jgi:uncharacterized membrane protein YqgA involved in biofilm formation